MKTIVVTGAIAAVAVGLFAVPAEAASSVQIRRVYYNSPGTDNRSNTSLNGEWVQLYNTAPSARQLRNYKIKDKTGYTYTFGSFTLGAKKSVYVHTGKGTNGSTHRYWGRSQYVWNNDGDIAYLLYPNGTKADSCSWGKSGSYKDC